MTRMGWLVVAVLIALAIGDVTAWFLGAAWWLHVIVLFALVAGVVVLVLAAMMGGEVEDEVVFVACPACGTRNPRSADGRYECYDCGRDFSELSGRHPVLPGLVSGRDDRR